MQSPARLVGIVVKLAPGVKRGQDNPLRRDAFFMHLHRNPPAVILHCTGAVRLECDPYEAALPGQMFVHRIVYNLIDQMV